MNISEAIQFPRKWKSIAKFFIQTFRDTCFFCMTKLREILIMDKSKDNILVTGATGRQCSCDGRKKEDKQVMRTKQRILNSCTPLSFTF
jgi:hypothetical protein